MPEQHKPKKEVNAGDLAFEVLEESFGVTKRQTKIWGKRAWRYLKMVGLMAVSGIVIPTVLIATGILLDRGFDGFVASLIAVLAAWGSILYFGLRRRATPKNIVRAPLPQLAEQLSEFLEASRRLIPASAKGSIEGILQHLEDLEPALFVLKEESPFTPRIRRLLTEDLTVIIDHYRRLPPRLRQKKLHGGPTPEEQLTSGLATLREALGRLNEDLAQEDLFSLAAKERYLEMKYGAATKRKS